MSLQQQITDQIKDAMRAKDTIRLGVLRAIKTAFTNELVATKRTPQEELSDEQALAVITRESKKRKDSIEQFTKAERYELAKDEQDELEVIQEFLPQLMSRDEIKKIVEAKKAEMGITDKSEMGKFIGAVMVDLKGKADGGDVKAVVEEVLG